MEKSVQRCIGFFVFIGIVRQKYGNNKLSRIIPSKTVGIQNSAEYGMNSKQYSLPKDRPKFIYYFGDKR